MCTKDPLTSATRMSNICASQRRDFAAKSCLSSEADLTRSECIILREPSTQCILNILRCILKVRDKMLLCLLIRILVKFSTYSSFLRAFLPFSFTWNKDENDRLRRSGTEERGNFNKSETFAYISRALLSRQSVLGVSNCEQ